MAFACLLLVSAGPSLGGCRLRWLGGRGVSVWGSMIRETSFPDIPRIRVNDPLA